MVKIVDIVADKPIDGVIRATIFGKVTNMTLSTNQIYTLLSKGAKVSEVLSNGERLVLSIRNYNTVNETKDDEADCAKKAAEEAAKKEAEEARIKEEAVKREAEAKAEAERLAAEKKAAEEAAKKEATAKKELENKKSHDNKKKDSGSSDSGNKNEDPQQ